MLPFPKLNAILFGYFDPEKIVLDNENDNFQVDLSDISAKKEPLRELLRCYT